MKKTLLIVLIVIVALIAICMGVGYFGKDKIAQMALQQTFPVVQGMVEKNMPDTINKEEVKELFDKTMEKVKAGTYDKAKFQELMFTIKDCLDDKELNKEEAQNIVDKLKEFVKE